MSHEYAAAPALGRSASIHRFDERLHLRRPQPLRHLRQHMCWVSAQEEPDCINLPDFCHACVRNSLMSAAHCDAEAQAYMGSTAWVPLHERSCCT